MANYSIEATLRSAGGFGKPALPAYAHVLVRPFGCEKRFAIKKCASALLTASQWSSCNLEGVEPWFRFSLQPDL
jgi:hypothetical protein